MFVCVHMFDRFDFKCLIDHTISLSYRKIMPQTVEASVLGKNLVNRRHLYYCETLSCVENTSQVLPKNSDI